MFTVTVSNYLELSVKEVSSLKDAIKEKYSYEVDHPGRRALIADKDGMPVSIREEKLYIIQCLV